MDVWLVPEASRVLERRLLIRGCGGWMRLETRTSGVVCAGVPGWGL